MRNKKGFTLIELLIVVAIIAILAAIAVPNFLEAQVRAKVARVKNDSRNLATGLESYYIDYSTYPPNNNGVGGGDPTLSSTSLGVLPVLSTPVAYVTSGIIEDPFGNQESLLGDGRSIIAYLNSSRDDFLADVVINTVAASTFGLTEPEQEQLFDQGFFVFSAGPDRITRIQEIAAGATPDAASTAANPSAADVAAFLGEVASNPTIYDPSNGTVSTGDIIRTRKGIFTPFLVGVAGL